MEFPFIGKKTERLNNLPKGTHLGSGRAGVQIPKSSSRALQPTLGQFVWAPQGRWAPVTLTDTRGHSRRWERPRVPTSGFREGWAGQQGAGFICSSGSQPPAPMHLAVGVSPLGRSCILWGGGRWAGRPRLAGCPPAQVVCAGPQHTLQASPCVGLVGPGL